MINYSSKRQMTFTEEKTIITSNKLLLFFNVVLIILCITTLGNIEKR